MLPNAPAVRDALLLTLVAVFAIAAPAGAQATSVATPNMAGKASRLQFDVDATLPPVSGRVPSALSFEAPSGFRFNTRAVAKRCSQLRASLNECTSKSRFGRGSLVIHVATPEGERDVTVPLQLHLRSKTRVFAIAFLAGTRVVPGTLDTSGRLALRFDPLPSPPPFQGVSYSLRRVTVNIGTSRRVKRKKRRVRISLLRNPETCVAGAWASSAALTFPDATTAVLPAPTSCSLP
jgi:hypothetical protein